MEDVFDDVAIGDREEGVALTHLKHAELTPGQPSQQRDFLRASGLVDIDDSASVTLNNVHFVNDVDAYIFSFSYGDFEELRRLMCDPASEPSYDAAIEILDIYYFAECVRAGTVEGRPVHERFHVLAGEVRYDQAVADFDELGVVGASVLRKRPNYAPQREWRIALIPKERQTLASELFVTIQDTAMLVEIFREPTESPKGASTPTTIDVPMLIEELNELLDAEDAARAQLYPTRGGRSNAGIAAEFEQQTEAANRAFEPTRHRLLKLWWELRKVHPDDDVDRAFQQRWAGPGHVVGALRRHLWQVIPPFGRGPYVPPRGRL